MISQIGEKMKIILPVGTNEYFTFLRIDEENIIGIKTFSREKIKEKKTNFSWTKISLKTPVDDVSVYYIPLSFQETIELIQQGGIEIHDLEKFKERFDPENKVIQKANDDIEKENKNLKKENLFLSKKVEKLEKELSEYKRGALSISEQEKHGFLSLFKAK